VPCVSHAIPIRPIAYNTTRIIIQNFCFIAVVGITVWCTFRCSLTISANAEQVWLCTTQCAAFHVCYQYCWRSNIIPQNIIVLPGTHSGRRRSGRISDSEWIICQKRRRPCVTVTICPMCRSVSRNACRRAVTNSAEQIAEYRTEIEQEHKNTRYPDSEHDAHRCL